jgi:hypothetical protein
VDIWIGVCTGFIFGEFGKRFGRYKREGKMASFGAACWYFGLVDKRFVF